MTKEFDIAVIGRGVAGHGVINYLLGSQIPGDIAWIGLKSQKRTALDCSWHSTALVAMHGIRKGVSPLGDLLVRSFNECKSFVERENPEGVEEVDRLHLSLTSVQDDKLVQRFGKEASQYRLLDNTFNGYHEKAYLFYPDVFMVWWSRKLSGRDLISEYDELALELSKQSDDQCWLIKMQKQSIRVRKVVMATGAMRCYLKLSEERLFKEVPGQYLLWSNINHKKSFVFTLNGHNLIYRQATKELLLSGTNEDNDLLLPGLSIFDILKLFKERLGQFIPSSKPRIVCGLRQKGRGRMPICEQTDSGLYIIDSFYKNGYSFCHTLGMEMAKNLTEG